MPLSAAVVIDLINHTVKEEKIKDPSLVYLFLDEMDISEKDACYSVLCKQNKYEEAFALPDKVTPEGKLLLSFCSRLGINVVLYTTRVDTKRVEKNAENFALELDFGCPVISEVICLRNEENKLMPISKIISESDFQSTKVTFGIIACSYGLRADDFVDNAPMFEVKKSVLF